MEREELITLIAREIAPNDGLVISEKEHPKFRANELLSAIEAAGMVVVPVERIKAMGQALRDIYIIAASERQELRPGWKKHRLKKIAAIAASPAHASKG